MLSYIRTYMHSCLLDFMCLHACLHAFIQAWLYPRKTWVFLYLERRGGWGLFLCRVNAGSTFPQRTWGTCRVADFSLDNFNSILVINQGKLISQPILSVLSGMFRPGWSEHLAFYQSTIIEICFAVLCSVTNSPCHKLLHPVILVILEGEEIEVGHPGQVRRLRGVMLEGEEIEGGHSGEVRRLRGVILEGEEIEMCCTRWPKATHRGRRPPAREASVPPAGTRRRAAERLELLVTI